MCNSPIVPGSVSLDAVAEEMGYIALSGIPGTLGGAIVQNAGAYGAEIADFVLRVQVYDTEQDDVLWMSRDECQFSYRSSVFKGGSRFIVLAAELRASEPEDVARCTATSREEVLGIRAEKGMLAPGFAYGDGDDPDRRGCGSFFTNPVVTVAVAEAVDENCPRWATDDGHVKLSAAWLIEHAGFPKGFSLPGSSARLSTKHTLALTHFAASDTAGADMRELALHIQNGVSGKFEIYLEPEPVML
jgi:UDP-N-acetylmuramate dehydrogenase